VSATAYIRSATPQLAILAVILILDRLVAPTFFDLAVKEGRLNGSLIDILHRAAPAALLALGMAPVIATRGIDLSVGAVMAIAGAVLASVVNAGWVWPVAVLAALAAGAACGLWNGFLVAVLGIQPFVATLVLMVAGRGLAQLVTEGRIVTFIEPHLNALGGGAAMGLPIPVLILICVGALGILLARLTPLGMFVEAVGVNPRASRLAGVDARAVTLLVYLGSGLAAAIAGVIVACDIHGADSNNAGQWMELDAILAVAVGGGSLLGGRFSLSRAILGAIAMQAMKTGILLAGFAPELNLVVMAAAVVLVLCIQSPALRGGLPRFLPR
jgi:ribose/xylose/arabinose/galactoside ABC-type transport system permease subunit